MSDLGKKQPERPVRAFTSLADRRTWLAKMLTGFVNSDPDYYKPILEAGEKGRQAYLTAYGRVGCGKVHQPTDIEMWAVLLNVSLPKGLDAKVMLHCTDCLPCFMHYARMLHHYAAELPGSAWSEEVGKHFPLRLKVIENPSWHMRIEVASLFNGPSFRVVAAPFDYKKKPVLIGSSAGVFGEGNYPAKDLAERTQREIEARFKESHGRVDKLDAITIVQLAQAFGFDADNEIFDFLNG